VLDQRLSRAERAVIAALLAVPVLFGSLVLLRSAFLQNRHTDVGVYLRAGWAVRTGGDVYDVTDDNHWHYHYPPLYAILMAPLADPPDGEVVAGYVSYPVSVAVCYVFNVACLFVAVHLLARALERSSPPVKFGRRWWLLRLVPVLVCLPPVGHTLMRGQVNLLLLALLCGMVAATLAGRRLLAGLCLAGAICLKIIPAFLLLYPLWQRDRRGLVGCAVGLVVGLLLIPSIVLGPPRTLASYRKQAEVLLGPALALNEDPSRARELLDVNASDSQSIQSVLTKTLYLEPSERPAHPPAWVRSFHWLLGSGLTLLTLAAAWRRSTDSGPAAVLLVGALTLMMLLVSPVCHTHYFCLSILLVMGLLAATWNRAGKVRFPSWLLLLLGLELVGNTLPLLPAFEVLKDVGLAAYSNLALWLAACVTLRRLPVPRVVETSDASLRPAA
jgi:hypothetical protein